MRRLWLVGLAALLATGAVLYLLPPSPAGESDMLDSALDGGTPGAARDSGSPRLRSGAPDAPPPSPPSDEVPVDPLSPGPGELLVLSVESQAPLTGAVVADADGTIIGRTEEDGLVHHERVPARGMDVRVGCAGFLPTAAHLEPDRRVEVALVPGVPVSGKFVRPGKYGRPGIGRVFVFDEDRRAKIATFSTDELGRFQIRAVRPNRPFLMTVKFVDLPPRTVRLVVDVPTSDLEVVIDAGGHLTGQVVDARGATIPDVEVRLLASAALRFEQRRAPESTTRAEQIQVAEATPTTRTDDYGRYAFHGVELEREFEVITILKPRLEARSKPVLFTKTGEKLVRDIHVPAMTSLRVRVEDRMGNALDDTRLTLESTSGLWTLQAADTRVDGYLVLEHLTPGTVTVTAIRPGEPTQSETVALEAGSETDVTLRFAGSATIRGRVRNKRGKPLAKARVHWTGTDPEERVDVQTDANGTFQLRSLAAPRGTLSVSARGREHAPFGYEGRVFEDLKVGGKPLDVTLRDGTRVTGEFRDLPNGSTVSSEMIPGGEADEALLALDEDGRFVRRGAPARSRAMFVFRTRGFAPLLRNEAFPFRSEEVRDLGMLTFVTTDPRKGRVLDERGGPVWAAKVTINAPWSSATCRTDRQGQFEFAHLPRVSTWLRVEVHGYPVHRVHFSTRSESQRQVIRLSPDVYVRFDVVDETDEKVGPSELTFARLGKKKSETRRRTNREGRLRRSMEPGRYRIRTRARMRDGALLTGDEVVEITSDKTWQVVELKIR